MEQRAPGGVMAMGEERRMSVGEVLTQTAHRPWPLPARPWVMTQSWCDLLFAHWPVPVEALRACFPPSLQIDTFEGQAWLGVVPFTMEGVRPRGLPAISWLSHFLELNLRTYVVVEDKPGVVFFSLDAANPLAVSLARRWYHLPYFRAQMWAGWQDDGRHYASWRSHRGAPPGEFVGRYRPTGPIYAAAPGTLERWLTERYCLYSVDRQGHIFRGHVQHVVWPLQPAEAEIERNTLAQGFGLTLPDTPPLLHFARRLKVVGWAPALVQANHR